MDQNEAFEKTQKFNAENCIIQTFPERIVHLYELLRKPEFCISGNYTESKLEMLSIAKLEIDEGKSPEQRSHSDLNASHSTIPGQIPHIPSNKNITKLIEILKPYTKQLVEDVNALKMWISLAIPKIEDGNNLGVAIQKRILASILRVEVGITNYLDRVNRYYTDRGKLISKIVKCPFIEDYQIAVDELDEKKYLSISIIMHEIFDCYSILYDMIIKNFDNIKNPRSSNGDSLY